MQEMRPQDGDLLQKIEQAYKTMSKGQKQIARYILENYDKAAFVTASKMGSVVGVSESTVVRFAYALGYDGYPELQRSLQEFIRNKLTSVQRIQLTDEIDQGEVLNTVLKADMNNIRATIESVDPTSFEQVVEGLIQAKNVYIVGHARLLRRWWSFLATTSTSCSTVCTPSPPARATCSTSLIRVSAEDVVLGISFPALLLAHARGDALCQGARGQGIRHYRQPAFPFWLRPPTSPCSPGATWSPLPTRSLRPWRSINAVIVALSMRKKDEVSARFAQLEGIWHKNRVYAGRENG